MSKKINPDKQVNYNQAALSLEARLWVATASPIEISKIMEIGYKIYNDYKVDEKKITSDLDIVKTLSMDINTNIQTMRNDLLSDNSKVKKTVILGQEGEEYVFNILNDRYDIRDMHDKAKSGDYFINDTILLEVKNYSNTIPKKELEKFKRDLEQTRKKAGLFISLNTQISSIGKMKRTTHLINGITIPVIYLYTRDEDIIALAVELLLVETAERNIIISEHISNMINSRIIELENNIKMIVSLRDNIKNLEEGVSGNINDMRKTISMVEGLALTNIGIIKRELKI